MKTPDEIKKGLECCYEGIDCTKCPYMEGCFEDDEKPYGLVVPDALVYIQQLEAQVPKWISVEDRLPEKAGKYLVHAHHWVKGVPSIITTALFYGGKWDKYNAYTVDHWMPLPEPPKED